MDQNTLQTILAALDRIEDMLDQTDADSAKKAFGPKEDDGGDAPDLGASGDDPKDDGALQDSPSEDDDSAESPDLEDELGQMASSGNIGAKGALSLFKKDKEDDEEDY